jgi:uncharacterized membrane protein
MPQRVEGNIEIEAPVETVYSYWETLENLPQFMANVEEVTPTGPTPPTGGSRAPSARPSSGRPRPPRRSTTAP